MISIRGYGCNSSAGVGVDALWNGLAQGIDHSEPVTAGKLSLSAYRFKSSSENLSAQERLVEQLSQAWREARSRFSSPLRGRIGLIYASAKGALEDFIWNPNESQLSNDPLVCVLEGFKKRAEINPTRSLCVSNACASSVAALWTAARWLNSNAVDHVIVLAADLVGPFVLQGFYSLKSLSETKLQPFGARRDGLRLGEAAAVICLSRGEINDGCPEITSIGLDTDGYAVTRPRGESLTKAIRLALRESDLTPDFIVAHGTGTQSNDETEDGVFTTLFGKNRPPISGTKWSIGHTLGASGAMDVITACEVLRRKEYFRIANTGEIDAKLSGSYLIQKSELPKIPARNVLISSLGFGGLHSAVFIRRNEGAS
jgi:hypothetical protein